jgi:alcohol dehydrogenase class IV
MIAVLSMPVGTSTTPYRRQERAQRVVFTLAGAEALKEELAAAGLERAIVVCSPRAAQSAFGQKVVRLLGSRCAGTFAEVAEHPSLSTVEQGARLARELHADCVVSLGGGSAVDVAKGLALRLATEHPLALWSTDRGDAPAPQHGGLVPILAVPLTLSGAECNQSAGLRDEFGRKLIIRDPDFPASVVILDPVASSGVPAKILLSTGINAIAHCLEALYSRARDPVSDAFALRGTALLHRGLSAMLDEPGELAPRADVLNGAHLAARAIVHARTGLHHAVCHVLGVAGGVSHGVTNAIMLPHALAFSADAGGPFLAEAAAILSPSERGEPATVAADAVERLCVRGGLARRLREVGVSRDALPGMANHVMLEPGLRFNPRQGITQENVVGLLRGAW